MTEYSVIFLWLARTIFCFHDGTMLKMLVMAYLYSKLPFRDQELLTSDLKHGNFIWCQSWVTLSAKVDSVCKPL